MGGRGGGAAFGSFGVTLRRLVAGDSSAPACGFVTAPSSTVLVVLARFLGVAACTTASATGFGSLGRVVGGIAMTDDGNISDGSIESEWSGVPSDVTGTGFVRSFA